MTEFYINVIIVDDTMAAVTVYIFILPHMWSVSVHRLAMVLHTCIAALVVLELVVNNQVKPHTRGNLTKV